MMNNYIYIYQMIASRIRFGFKIIKTTNGPNGLPLPNMTQYFLTDGNNSKLSFWNDLPINLSSDTVNISIEIPKEQCAKFQVAKAVPFHPFMHDTRKNIFTKQQQLRYYAQFPLFNYGFIPQTWEQNLVKDELGLYGDDDPIDICDLSQGQKKIGDIFRAKVLGSFCLIDQGEVDWKVLLIDAQEAAKKRISSLDQLPKQQIRAVMDWFKFIKVFDGKKPNQIAYDEKLFSKDETLSIISETHKQWKKLVGSPDPIYNQIRKKYHLPSGQ